MKDRFLAATFVRLDRFDELPSAVKSDLLTRFASRSSSKAPLIANPDEAYNPSDTVSNELPSRRLRFAGTSDRLWFVLYNSGGITTELHLVMYDDSATSPVFKGRVLNAPTPTTIDELKAAIGHGGVVDEGVQSRFW